jgi:hypothetical protein
MTETHNTKFAGLELEVTGYYDSGETGDYFHPDSPAYFEVEQITVDGIDLTELFERIGFTEIENQVFEENYA